MALVDLISQKTKCLFSSNLNVQSNFRLHMTKNPITGTGTTSAMGRNLFSSRVSLQASNIGIVGRIQIVIILLVLNQGELYPSLNLETPAKSCKTQHPISSYQADQSLQYTLYNSLGFDCNCSALIFSKV